MGRVRNVLDAALRDEWDGLERINRDLRLADLFTLLNAFMGLGALFLAARGEVHWAVHLVLAGIILDGVDGAVARLGKGNGPLGGTLDSLADALSFVTTPAIIMLLWYQRQGLPEAAWQLALVFAGVAFYAACGLLRLARFESLRDDGRTRHYFSGLPSPAAAMTVLAMILLEDIRPAVIVAVGAYIGLLMTSRIRFPKMRGWLGVGAATMLLLVLSSFQNRELQEGATITLLAFMALYVVFGPFYVLARYGPTEGPQARLEARA